MTTVVTVPTGTPPPARPENVPEKFWDAEKGAINTDALLQSYTELERTRGTPAPTPTPTPPPSTKIDVAALDKELTEKGEVSAETYAKYEAQGIPREMIDGYVSGLQADFEKFEADVHKIAGGEDQYDAVRNWAKTNVSRGELDAFNKALEGTPEQALLAVEGLVAKYRNANGNPPNLVNPGSGTPGANVFNSWHEVTQAMSDPRYAKDPAYRKSVEEKLGRSDPKFV